MNYTTANAGTYYVARILAGRYAPPRRPLLPALLAVLAALTLLWPTLAKAEDPLSRTDLKAHFGVSSLINTGFYGIYRKTIGMGPYESAWFSLISTTFIGLVKEMNDDQPDEADIWAGVAGSLTSNVLCVTFDF